MMLLLAQLVAPPVQNGPVRLPGPDAVEQRPAEPGQSTPPAELQTEPGLTAPTGQPDSPAGAQGSGQSLAPMPRIEGAVALPQEELERILAPCRRIADPGERLNACAAALTATLTTRGYINTRVYVQATPEPGGLQVVDGRIVELRVAGSDARLNARIQRLLRPLQGQVLYLPKVDQQLQLLQRQPGVASLRGNLTRLGSDVSQAVLTVTVNPGSQPWQGDLSLRNDGSNTSGEFRGTATLIKPTLAVNGDTLLFYGEVDTDDVPRFGSLITSLSYSLPLSDRLTLTGAIGYSRRNLIELPAPADGFSTSQYQGLGQLEWLLSESLSSRWSLFAGYSQNRSNTYFQDQSLPDVVPDSVRMPTSGYLRVGVNGSGIADRFAWGGNAYLLQGLATAVPAEQRQELSRIGVNASQATAVGGLFSAGWGFAPGWQLNIRAGGQYAFEPLLSAMQFTLGSDVGLRGLPGQLISGDSGLLGTAETVWTFWQNRHHALQLIPFIGTGVVRTSISDVTLSDTIGSGGVLVRWLADRNWSAELGWVQSFESDNNPGPWNDWLLGNGLYVKVGYRF